MKYYAVIDTNVLVSAMLKWNSVPGSIIELSFTGTIVPLYNDDILREYRIVLARPKFHLSDDIINSVVDEIINIGFNLEADQVEIELPDPKDRVFYEVVMAGRKSEEAYLVTGNIKHFPEKPYIVTPRQMLDLILENN